MYKPVLFFARSRGRGGGCRTAPGARAAAHFCPSNGCNELHPGQLPVGAAPAAAAGAQLGAPGGCSWLRGPDIHPAGSAPGGARVALWSSRSTEVLTNLDVCDQPVQSLVQAALLAARQISSCPEPVTSLAGVANVYILCSTLDFQQERCSRSLMFEKRRLNRRYATSGECIMIFSPLITLWLLLCRWVLQTSGHICTAGFNVLVSLVHAA